MRRTAFLFLLLLILLSIQASAAIRDFNSPVEQNSASLVLDTNPGAMAAYSLRRLTLSYSGDAIRVRRSSDDQEMDIGFTSQGSLDITALESFAEHQNAYVVVWFDQSGHGVDLHQSIPEFQPQIVRDGKVLRDSDGLPKISFGEPGTTNSDAELLTIGEMQPVSNHDLTLFILQQSLDSNQEAPLFSLNLEKSYNYLRFAAKDNFGVIKLGDGNSNITIANIPSGLVDKSLQVLALTEGKVDVYRNGSLTGSYAHTKSSGVSTRFSLGSANIKWGSYHGYISEFLMYPSLKLEETNSIYLNINSHYRLGGAPLLEKPTLLPQDWTWQVDLYSWLKSISIEDVSITPRSVVWDGTYRSVDELANLTLALAHEPTSALLSESRWYVLDDGKGAGIVGSGQVRIPYKDDEKNTGGFGSDPAFWYQLNIPLANGGQGNPYYRDPAVAKRALIISAVEMMMWAKELDRWSNTARNDYYGKALSSWAYVYLHCADILDEVTRRAFEQGFLKFIDRTIHNGAHDINTNMDMFFVHAAAIIYAATDNVQLQDRAIEGARKILFGNVNGNIGLNHDVESGTFFPAGYIAEADGPETTYNGHSFEQLVGALLYVRSDPEWSFLTEVVRRMAEFKIYQYFADPAVGGSRQFWTGPSGYAGRTGGSYVRDQGADKWRDLTAATLLESALPLAYSYKWGGWFLSTPQEMIADVKRRIDRINNVNTVQLDLPPVFRAYSSWPPDIPYYPSNWYSKLTTAIATNEAQAKAPLIREGYYYNIEFGGAPTGGEFWAYKGHQSYKDFAFFIEADAHQGSYSGWYGGKLEAFWIDDVGTLILNAHDKTGCEDGKRENTTCWDQVDVWGAHHVWGRDEHGHAFSTADIRDRNGSRRSTFNVTADVPTVEVVNVFNDPQLRPGGDGEETGEEINGVLSIVNRFEAQSNGLKVTHIVTSDGSDEVTELWASLPINLRYNSEEGGGQALIPDATIEYWDGTAWVSLTTEVRPTLKLRIGRDYLDGSGPRYGYIAFESTAQVRLSPHVWQQSYQGYHRLRNLQISLHEDPGTPSLLPKLASISYTIQTTNPVLTRDVQTIQLRQGWQLVSGSVIPFDSRLDAVLQDLVSKVVAVKNASGDVYFPEYGINQVGHWRPDAAYEIKMKESATLTLEGIHVDPEMTIKLNEGWNLVPYPLTKDLPVEEALASIKEKLLIVVDQDGREYIPGKKVNDLRILTSGSGYRVNVNSPATLTYPLSKE